MNEQIKKQTNMGILFAILGFTMIGGALVLIPKLVEEKVKTLAPGTETTDAASVAPGETPDENADSTSADTGEPPTATAAAAETDSNAADKPDDKKEAASSTAATASGTGPWTFTILDKFETDDAGKAQLETIVALMKSDNNIQLQVVGMNNMRKSSKLAQMAANRIANTITKEAAISYERVEPIAEQQADMNGILVKVRVVGGAQ